MSTARQPAPPLPVPRTGTLAYTGSLYHLPECPRAVSAGRMTFAARAVANRVPCPVCLPAGVRIVP